MKIEVSMKTEHMFEVMNWWAKSPEFVLEALRAQLKAASAIWPELQCYSVGKRAPSSGKSVETATPEQKHVADQS